MSRNFRLILALCLAITTLFLGGRVALAASMAREAPGESNLGFLFAGFAVVWVGLIVYAFYVGRRESALRREIEELRQQLVGREAPGDA